MVFLGAQEVQIITTCVIKKAVDVVSFFKFVQIETLEKIAIHNTNVLIVKYYKIRLDY